MTHFSDCLNGLDKIINAQYGQYRPGARALFTQEVADYIVQAGELEQIDPAMLAITLMNENIFDLRPMPNTNEHPEDTSRWDVGPGHLNIFWTGREIETNIKQLNREEIPTTAWRGSAVANHPAPFDGDVLANIRMVARVLLVKHPSLDPPGVSESLQETQVVHYVGEEHREHRREDWRKYDPLFWNFFNCYTMNP